jgi:hypothetical protein
MFCYRFPDRETFLGLCDTLGWLSVITDESPEATLIAYTSDRAIDEVGSIEVTPGAYDEEGNELTPPVMDTRHHVNFIGEHPAEFDAYLILVNSPYRQFAGSSGPSADPNAPVEPGE